MGKASLDLHLPTVAKVVEILSEGAIGQHKLILLVLVEVPAQATHKPLVCAGQGNRCRRKGASKARLPTSAFSHLQGPPLELSAPLPGGGPLTMLVLSKMWSFCPNPETSLLPSGP